MLALFIPSLQISYWALKSGSWLTFFVHAGAIVGLVDIKALLLCLKDPTFILGVEFFVALVND